MRNQSLPCNDGTDLPKRLLWIHQASNLSPRTETFRTSNFTTQIRVPVRIAEARALQKRQLEVHGPYWTDLGG
jgi:hypothetical protein